ncbi:MAG: hypothetical protein Q7J68_08095 [Thermoplasmata archaeon]|nr:hypothetical protein [Thermoplasmata archaeon]
MKIELYLNSEKGHLKAGYPYYETLSSKSIGTWHGPSSGYYIPKDVFVGYSEEEKEMRDQITRMADKYNFELKVYDVSKTRYRFRAFFKGVRETPTAVIGRKKFIGTISEDEILAAIKK